MNAPFGQISRWTRFFPPATWLADYRSAWLRPDAIAGITLAAYAIPVSLAYATLAGLPPQIGIYGYMLGGVGYALLGSSRQLAVGPTSAISLMIAATVGALAGGDAAKYAEIASLVACAVALLCFVSWLQGRGGAHHHHEPIAEPARCRRRRPQFFRSRRQARWSAR
jgi:MFS superfamily sulfate permease-like transporter